MLSWYWVLFVTYQVLLGYTLRMCLVCNRKVSGNTGCLPIKYMLSARCVSGKYRIQNEPGCNMYCYHVKLYLTTTCKDFNISTYTFCYIFTFRTYLQSHWHFSVNGLMYRAILWRHNACTCDRWTWITGLMEEYTQSKCLLNNKKIA